MYYITKLTNSPLVAAQCTYGSGEFEHGECYAEVGCGAAKYRLNFIAVANAAGQRRLYFLA